MRGDLSRIPIWGSTDIQHVIVQYRTGHLKIINRWKHGPGWISYSIEDGFYTNSEITNIDLLSSKSQPDILINLYIIIVVGLLYCCMSGHARDIFLIAQTSHSTCRTQQKNYEMHHISIALETKTGKQDISKPANSPVTQRKYEFTTAVWSENYNNNDKQYLVNRNEIHSVFASPSFTSKYLRFSSTQRVRSLHPVLDPQLVPYQVPNATRLFAVVLYIVFF